MSTEYKPRKDSGSLRATTSKRSDKSPDYWGDIAIDLRDQTNLKIVDGLTIVRVNGWKKADRSGKTFLSLAVDRFVPRSQGSSAPAPQNDFPDDDSSIPF